MLTHVAGKLVFASDRMISPEAQQIPLSLSQSRLHDAMPWMDEQQKILIALAALGEHEAIYEIPVPERIRRFFRTGDAFTHNKKCFFPDPDVEIPGFAEPGSFRLIVTIPSWATQAALGPCDTTVVGPLGGWIHVHKVVPLFSLNKAAFIVAQLDDPKCPIGFFDESAWSRTASDSGVYPIARSLDEFLVELVSLDEADYEAADPSDRIWRESEMKRSA